MSISYVLAGGLLYLFIRIKNKAAVTEYLGFKKTGWKPVFIALAVTIVVGLAFDGIASLLNKPAANEIMLQVFKTSIWPVLLWIVLIILAPLFEEAFFRSFLFEGFRQSKLGLMGATVITSLLWATNHIQYDLFGIAQIFILGIVMGIVRDKTGSIWSTISMHALINLMATVQITLYINGNI
jgi:hypothetical protein